MYPDGYSAYVEVEGISSALCGAARPGHFRGVATVVLKLFNIVAPDAAVFGAKDAQQVAVIRRMAEDLNLPVRIVTAPTLREPDGLAMSSRNAYLTADERKQAASISGGLFEARRMFGAGERSVEKIRECALSIINGSGGLIRVEYVEVVGVENFQSLQNDIDTPALIAAACRTGESGTRMIDNVELKQ
jgi:pantoate--beta-alanine ligase